MDIDYLSTMTGQMFERDTKFSIADTIVDLQSHPILTLGHPLPISVSTLNTVGLFKLSKMTSTVKEAILSPLMYPIP